MDRATEAAIRQLGLAGAVVDGAGALVHVVMTVECHIHLQSQAGVKLLRSASMSIRATSGLVHKSLQTLQP